MKTTSIFTAITLSSTIWADPFPDEVHLLHPRDLATVQQVIQSVSTSLTQLDTTVKAFDGSNLNQLTTDASALVDTLKQGITKVQGTTPLTLQDALSLQSTVTDLQTKGQTLLDSLTAKKSQIEKAGLCTVVQTNLKDVSDQSKALIDAVVQKVPQEAQTIAGNLASGVTSTLQGGQASFGQGNCTNAAGAAGAGGGGGGGGGGMPTPVRGGGGGGDAGGMNQMTPRPPVVTAAAAVNSRAPVAAVAGLIAALLW
ncbi:hydrophobic surface binding protein A-domain-containing protein [Pseudomassariella vexata]|uniref:Hydrophobic surface binding protein A-domain-containing protein n=1 Tax=Pseudomassariella vexata TaxID=1141098 RepID=A0A1Y2EKQ6_9PEZI|nr:hydrophobic surface binding protein A-domain-containing protein [Pseudomassariella vexata]ORY72109.1 hydrophobic surface binding protein A-domain-containing protein [Pseudomassariella vexata]